MPLPRLVGCCCDGSSAHPVSKSVGGALVIPINRHDKNGELVSRRNVGGNENHAAAQRAASRGGWCASDSISQLDHIVQLRPLWRPVRTKAALRATSEKCHFRTSSVSKY